MPIIQGTSASETLFGTAANDTLRGREGNDTLVSSLGSDLLYGGVGIDTASYGLSRAAVSINLKTATFSGGDAEGDQLFSIERIGGSDFSDLIVGNGADNRLFGRSGNDTLRGGDGDDRIAGGVGADSLNGGSGDDWLSYGRSHTAVTINLETSLATGGDATGDQFVGFEHVSGSRHADSLTGDAGDNLLHGRTGNDTLSGGAGDDRLAGGAGADLLEGGTGFDIVTYSGDTIYRYGAIIDIRSGTTSGVAAGDQFTSIEGFVGTSVGDSFVLGDADNWVNGRDGDDFIDAGNGNDSLVGGVGADFLHGGTGIDTAIYRASDAGVTIHMQTGAMSGGHAAGDTLSWIENIVGSAFSDDITGDILDNHLRGLTGDDHLRGADGADTLVGGGGADTLEGGNGSDSFRFLKRSDHTARTDTDTLGLDAFQSADADLITDFTSGTDVLGVRQAQFANTVHNTGTIADLSLTSADMSAFAFHAGNLFHVRYDSATDFAAGQATVTHLARLSGIASLNAADFDFL